MQMLPFWATPILHRLNRHISVEFYEITHANVTPVNATTNDHDDMPDEIDLSGGVRGKFYHFDTQLRLPILYARVQDTLAAIANAKGIDLPVFVNDLLRKDIELIQMRR
jgi:hypothetical protein